MILAIDIGGTGIKSAVFQAGKLMDKAICHTPPTWDLLCVCLQDLVNKYSSKYQISGLAFSVPGIPNQASGRVEGASSLRYIHQVNFVAELTQLLHLPLSFANDANCACLAEMNRPDMLQVKNFLMLVIGTGIGGTIVYDRKIIAGTHNFAGEFGMMLVDGHNELAILGSPVHTAERVSRQKGRKLSGEEVFVLADAHDVEAEAALAQMYHYLALGIYNLQYILDPQVIVLGGGITARLDLTAKINSALQEIMAYGQRAPLTPVIRTATYGNDANLLGAAYYFTEKFE